MKTGRGRRALRLARLAFTPLAVCFLAFMGWQAWDSFAGVLRDARPGWLAAAVCAWVTAHLCSASFARAALLSCGSDLDYARSLRIHVARLPARYLPGGVWHTVARVADFRALGVPAGHLGGFVLLENAVAVASALALGGALLWVTREPDAWTRLAGWAALAGAVGLLITPALVARLTRREAPLARPRYAQSVLAFAAFWCLASAAFACYALAFPLGFATHSVPELAGTYLLSWGIGFLAVFAPQGLGVFEGVAGDMLRSDLGLASTAILVAGFRVVVLTGDAIIWAVLAFTRPSDPQRR